MTISEEVGLHIGNWDMAESSGRYGKKISSKSEQKKSLLRFLGFFFVYVSDDDPKKNL